ncbi:MAG: hypothetical protein M1409_02540, partial [Actinobacteria bacterium]|nr:hypothetical protein [Actinomycetota bacterium]
IIKIKSSGTIEIPRLKIELFPDTVNLQSLRRTLKWMLSTEDNLTEFYKIVSKNPKYNKIINRFYGLRPPKTPTIYESLIIAISEQEISLKAAASIRERLIKIYGSKIEKDAKFYYIFPTPQSLAAAKVQDIRKIGFTIHKAEYMIDISKKILSGDLNLEELRTMSSEEIIKFLGKIRGLGPWTIKYVLARGMGRHDLVPFEDIGLRSSLARFLGKEGKVSEQEAKEFFEPFKEYKGYMSFYLMYEHIFNLN